MCNAQSRMTAWMWNLPSQIVTLPERRFVLPIGTPLMVCPQTCSEVTKSSLNELLRGSGFECNGRLSNYTGRASSGSCVSDWARRARELTTWQTGSGLSGQGPLGARVDGIERRFRSCPQVV
jgi:hypothetical protein